MMKWAFYFLAFTLVTGEYYQYCPQQCNTEFDHVFANVLHSLHKAPPMPYPAVPPFRKCSVEIQHLKLKRKSNVCKSDDRQITTVKLSASNVVLKCHMQLIPTEVLLHLIDVTDLKHHACVTHSVLHHLQFENRLKEFQRVLHVCPSAINGPVNIIGNPHSHHHHPHPHPHPHPHHHSHAHPKLPGVPGVPGVLPGIPPLPVLPAGNLPIPQGSHHGHRHKRDLIPGLPGLPGLSGLPGVGQADLIAPLSDVLGKVGPGQLPGHPGQGHGKGGMLSSALSPAMGIMDTIQESAGLSGEIVARFVDVPFRLTHTAGVRFGNVTISELHDSNIEHIECIGNTAFKQVCTCLLGKRSFLDLFLTLHQSLFPCYYKGSYFSSNEANWKWHKCPHH